MKSLIDRMVDRFLGWPLPKTFGPDCGISFKALPHPNGWPIGTNLFTATEARQMFEHALDGAAPEMSLRELDSIGHSYFNGPLNSNEEMFGRAVERAVRGRLLGTASVAPTCGARPLPIKELLAIYDEQHGDWCRVVREVERRHGIGADGVALPDGAKHG